MKRINYTYYNFGGKVSNLYFVTKTGSVHQFVGEDIDKVAIIYWAENREPKISKYASRHKSFTIKVYRDIRIVHFEGPITKSIKKWDTLAKLLNASLEDTKLVINHYSKEVAERLK